MLNHKIYTNYILLKMRKLLNILILSFLFLGTAVSLQGRDVTSFNDGWSFKKGPFNVSAGLLNQSFMAGGWQEVTIPHTWNAEDMQREMANTTAFRNPQERFYTGEALYKKTYRPDASLADKRIFLKFEGVGSVAEVFVNNQFAGRHKGAYSAFAVEISRLLKIGEDNEIIVKADNLSRPDVIPVNNVLFGVYGGIYRDIELIVTEKINIAVTDYASPGIYITQDNVSKSSARASVEVKVENKEFIQKEVKIVYSIFDMDNKLVTKSEKNVMLPPQGRQQITQDLTVR